MVNTGLGWTIFTTWGNKVTTNWWWSWRTGQERRCTPSTAASTWNQRARATGWGWAPTRATLATPSAVTMANSSLHSTVTRMHFLVGGIYFMEVPDGFRCQLVSQPHSFCFTMLCPCPLGNCAHFHKGGWWYNACGQTNLNGVWYSGGVYRSKFQDGIFWAEYGGGFYSLKSVRLMIRPIDWNLTLWVRRLSRFVSFFLPTNTLKAGSGIPGILQLYLVNLKEEETVACVYSQTIMSPAVCTVALKLTLMQKWRQMLVPSVSNRSPLPSSLDIKARSSSVGSFSISVLHFNQSLKLSM